MFFDSKHGPQNPGAVLLCALLGLSTVAWLWADVSLKRLEMRAVGKAPLERHLVTVSGEGKIVAKPDIATISVGLYTEGAKVADAQKENSTKFNGIIAKMKQLGVGEDDIKTTSYYINPRYEYTGGRSTLIGYSVSQEITVKVRDLAKVSQVIDAAGSLGANQVGGLQFTIDERAVYEEQARSEAIAQAKQKAGRLAREAGFRLGKLVNFSENIAMPYPLPYMKAAPMAEGMGGGGAPDIQSGSLDVVSNVSLTYEIE